jgi:hypothetical protein
MSCYNQFHHLPFYISSLIDEQTQVFKLPVEIILRQEKLSELYVHVVLFFFIRSTLLISCKNNNTYGRGINENVIKFNDIARE